MASQVALKETLVLASFPAIGSNSLVRLSDPDRPVQPLHETLLVIEPIPQGIRRFFDEERREDWAYARYVLTKLRGDWVWVDGLEFGVKHRVPLARLPVGLVAQVAHIPVYTQEFPTVIWPDWKLPPKKKWLVIPRPGSH